jgi:ABC-type transport system involved in multi-copper enzyme maturation permease subunit
MNAKTTRIVKEARPLFWPWCAVTLAGALPLVSGSHAGWTEGIGAGGFFGGILLLATLSFGNEFQHRTLSLLLSQPVDRMEIWREKLSVTIVVVLSAALVFYYGWRSVLQQDPQLRVFAGVYVISAIASATLWTLFARSTLGGIALNILALDLFLLSFVIVERLLAHSTAGN